MARLVLDEKKCCNPNKCILGKSAPSSIKFLDFMATFYNFDFKIKTVNTESQKSAVFELQLCPIPHTICRGS